MTKHIDTAAYAAAKLILDNEESVWNTINPLFKLSQEQHWTEERLARRIERAIHFMCGYMDDYTPPISRRSLHFWALGTAADEFHSY